MRMDHHKRVGDNPINNAAIFRLSPKATADGRLMRPAQDQNCRDKRYRYDKSRQHAEARKYTELENRHNARKAE